MTIPDRIELTTSDEGVLLLEFIANDARPLFELINNNRDHLNQWNDETASKYPDFESVLRSITNPKNPDKIRLGIWSDGVLAGTINITPKAMYTREIGYWVGSEFCGKGLATIATKRVVLFGHRNGTTDRMIANARIENLASQRVLLKAGMFETRRDDTLVWFTVNTES